MEFKEQELIKSPLNYTGSKFKLLSQILPYIPNNINLHGFEYYGCSSKTGRRIGVYNDDKYLRLREEYNKNPTPQGLYTLSSFAFNNQIRFNKNNKLKVFKDKIIDNINFTNKDFKELKLDNLNNQDLIYCDPPYLVTCASYNEQDGWNETHERELLELLEKANEKGIRFALSNVLENKGKSNDILKEWCQKYNTYHLNNTYGNCNYHAKDKSTSSTDEVLITNYII